MKNLKELLAENNIDLADPGQFSKVENFLDKAIEKRKAEAAGGNADSQRRLEILLAGRIEFQDYKKNLVHGGLKETFANASGNNASEFKVGSDGLRVKLIANPKAPGQYELEIYQDGAKGLSMVGFKHLQFDNNSGQSSIECYDMQGHKFKTDIRLNQGNAQIEVYAQRDHHNANKAGRDGYSLLNQTTFIQPPVKPSALPEKSASELTDKQVREHIKTVQAWFKEKGLIPATNPNGTDSVDGVFGKDTTRAWQRVVAEAQQSSHYKGRYDVIYGANNSEEQFRSRTREAIEADPALKGKIPKNVLDAMSALQHDDACCRKYQLIAEPSPAEKLKLKEEVEQHPVLFDAATASVGGGGPRHAIKPAGM